MLGESLLGQSIPWIVQGDFNFVPSDLVSSGWLQTVRGDVGARAKATCAGVKVGKVQLDESPEGPIQDVPDNWISEVIGGSEGGRILDYFIVSERLLSRAKRLEVLE